MSQALFGQRGRDNTGLPGRMLNDYLTTRLQFNRHLRDTYIFKKTKDHKRNWRGGPYPIVFEAGEASNYQSGGGLIPADDIQSESFVRGHVDGYKEIRSSYIFFEKDFDQHGKGARVPQDTFLKMQIQKKVNKNKNRFNYLFNHSILNGGALVSGTANAAGGSNTDRLRQITVDRPDKLTIGQKLRLQVAPRTREQAVDAYVTTLNMNSKVVTLGATRGGTQGPIIGATWANNAVVNLYSPGDEIAGNSFTSLRSQILPGSIAGGSNTIFGLTKADFPFLQPIQGTAPTDTTPTPRALLDAIFDWVVDFGLFGQPIGAMDTYEGEKGDRTTKNQKMGITVDIMMSVRWFAVFQKYRDRLLGGNWPQGSMSRFYDSRSFTMQGPDGLMLKFVAIESMKDDVFFLLGDDVTQYATLNYIQQSMSPDGNKWTDRRIANGNPQTDGLSYICDFKLYGDFIVKRPAGTGYMSLGGVSPSDVDFTKAVNALS